MLVNVKAAYSGLGLRANSVDIATRDAIPEEEGRGHKPQTWLCLVAEEDCPHTVVLPATQKAVQIVILNLSENNCE